jgi:hypothetical protein
MRSSGSLRNFTTAAKCHSSGTKKIHLEDEDLEILLNINTLYTTC